MASWQTTHWQTQVLKSGCQSDIQQACCNPSSGNTAATPCAHSCSHGRLGTQKQNPNGTSHCTKCTVAKAQRQQLPIVSCSMNSRQMLTTDGVVHRVHLPARDQQLRHRRIQDSATGVQFSQLLCCPLPPAPTRWPRQRSRQSPSRNRPPHRR
jgi:hypothetical protein